MYLWVCLDKLLLAIQISIDLLFGEALVVNKLVSRL